MHSRQPLFFWPLASWYHWGPSITWAHTCDPVYMWYPCTWVHGCTCNTHVHGYMGITCTLYIIVSVHYFTCTCITEHTYRVCKSEQFGMRAAVSSDILLEPRDLGIEKVTTTASTCLHRLFSNHTRSVPIQGRSQGGGGGGGLGRQLPPPFFQIKEKN